MALFGIRFAHFMPKSTTEIPQVITTLASRESLMRNTIFIFITLFISSVQAETYSALEGKHEVCVAVLRYLNNFDIPNEELAVEPIEGSNEEHNEENTYNFPDIDSYSLFPSFFDFDNDGKIDQVFIRGYDGSYMWGTKLFVRNNSFTENWSSKVLNSNSLNVYPCQYDKASPMSNLCPPFSQKADESGIEYYGLQNIFFRGRYTNLVPLRFKKATYLFVSEQKKNISALIKPQPNNKYLSVCLFKSS